MFETFFYRLRDYGLPMSPTAFLRLQRALASGLIVSLDDFYVVARSLLIKRERHFDLYDQIFANYFHGKDIDDQFAADMQKDLERLLQQWLQDPRRFEGMDGDEQERLQSMTPEELLQYFMDRLRDQAERHDGGNKWIGTGGTSPVGHGGKHPGGMRIGGEGGGLSAIKVALDRRFIDYADDTPLTAEQLGEALRTLRHLAPVGPKDRLNVDKTIDETVRQGGEISLVFDRRLRDKLNVMLFVDNGGYSMTPYVERTRALFTHARDSFKRLRTFFFHNCIYDTVWEDSERWRKPVPIEEILRAEPDTRIIVLGDASMSPYELMHAHGGIEYNNPHRRAGIDCLTELAARFPRHVWINPIHETRWDYTLGSYTIALIREIYPMVDLTLGGIERLVELLKGK